MIDFIKQYPNALSQEFCKGLIDYFYKAKEAGFVYPRIGSHKFDKDDENFHLHYKETLDISSEINLASTILEVVKQALFDYVKEFQILGNLANIGIYSIKLQKTELGQGYHLWHCENNSRELCHRILAWNIYLNDVEEGGETEFLYQHKRVKPQTGNLVMWPAGFTHVHRGNPPISNTKYILTGWVEY